MTARQAYRAFIDELAENARDNLVARRIRADGHAERTNTRDLPLTDEEQARKTLLLSLDRNGREIIARMLEDEHVAGAHDVLAHLNWSVAAERLNLGADGVSFDTVAEDSFHFDFIARHAGDPWPSED